MSATPNQLHRLNREGRLLLVAAGNGAKIQSADADLAIKEGLASSAKAPQPSS